jgi:hypothetical protein
MSWIPLIWCCNGSWEACHFNIPPNSSTAPEPKVETWAERLPFDIRQHPVRLLERPRGPKGQTDEQDQRARVRRRFEPRAVNVSTTNNTPSSASSPPGLLPSDNRPVNHPDINALSASAECVSRPLGSTFAGHGDECGAARSPSSPNSMARARTYRCAGSRPCDPAAPRTGRGPRASWRTP